MMKYLKAALVSVAMMFVMTGCEQPQVIDRTMPNYMKKSDLLDGTWYIKESVVDAPKTPGNPITIGYGGDIEKIRWEFQEDLLVGYRSYEIVPGADPLVDRENSTLGNVKFKDGRKYKGNPVFAYPVKHFDRQRQYNPATGEQSNVLEENGTDRPWYERDFARVDWRTNSVYNFSNCNQPNGTLENCGSTRKRFFRYLTDQDQQSVDQSIVQERNPNGELVYFDHVTQAIHDPESVYYDGYGMLPYCLFDSTVDCESGDVRIRTSVLKVDQAVANDYEPLLYSDKLMTKFGMFRQESYTYSKDHYYTYSGQQFMGMRHNIWQKAHNADGSTIPVTERQVRPVVYYMTNNTPEYLKQSASQFHAKKAGTDPKETIEASWDRAYRKAVAIPRGLEWNDPKVDQMFYVCQSPVQEGDPAACGKAGTYARIGDLRYNLIPYVEQNAGGLLGLGPSAMDPETGRVVHAAANIYGLGLDTWAGDSMLTMEVVNGEVSLSELVTGKNIKDYVFNNLNATDPRRPSNGPWQSQQPLVSDATRSASSFGKTTNKLKTQIDSWKQSKSMPIARENRHAVVEQMIKNNPALESELINLPEVKLGVQGLTSNKAFLAKLSTDSEFYRKVAMNLVMGKDPIEDARRAVKNKPDPKIGCYYELDYSDDDYVGVAKRKLKLQNDLIAKFKVSGAPTCSAKTSCSEVEAKVAAKAEVYNSLRREAYRSVTEHEIGHTLGMMHNFIASADALNYHDGYWDMRKETIGVQVGNERVLPITPANLADAAKPNQNQIDKGMYEYTYSSIMDYGARVTSQNRGTGKYDDAFILFTYGGGYEPGWVEVFNEMRNDYKSASVTIPLDNKAKVFTARGAHVEMPIAIAEHYTPYSNFYTDKYHYTTLPFQFADANGSFEGMLNQGVARMKNRSYRKWSEMEGHYKSLARALKTYNLSFGEYRQDPVTGNVAYNLDFVRATNIMAAAYADSQDGKEATSAIPNADCSGVPCNRPDTTSFALRANGAAQYTVEVFVPGTYSFVIDLREKVPAGGEHVAYAVSVNGTMAKSGSFAEPGFNGKVGFGAALKPGKHQISVAYTNAVTGQTNRVLNVDKLSFDIMNFEKGGEKHMPVEVPYMFCSDYEVGANLLCNRNDQGADVFEMTSKWIERFNESYVFLNFRRDKLTYSPSGVAFRKLVRYLDNIPNVYQQWLFNIYFLANYYDLSAEELDKYYGLGDPIYQNYWTMAVVDSTNLLMEQLSIPQAGYHGQKSDGTWEYVKTGDALNRRLDTPAEQALISELRKPQNGGYSDVLYIPRGPGRSMFSVYDSFGYDGFNRVNEAGHFWDVRAAMFTLASSETNFLGVDRGSDALRYSLPYYQTFNLELAPLFNNYWAENSSYFAARVGKNTDGTGVVQPAVFLRAENYIDGFVYPVAAPTPIDGGGNPMVMSKVIPVTTWSTRFWAQVYSMAFFTTNGNMEFANFNNVYRLGGGDNLTPSTGFEVVSVADSFGGGYSYAALKKIGQTNPPAAAAVVEKCKTETDKWNLSKSTNQPVDGLTAAQWEQKVRETTRTLEMMRGLFGIFGRF
jgi:hypothetical protein